MSDAYQRIITRLSICVVLSISSVAFSQDQLDEKNHNLKNVLFIAVDDLRPELGCYGVEYAQTPELDRLAEQSVLFTRHYVQVPTCGASRYALLTGRSPANSGVTSGNVVFYRGKSALSQKRLAGAQSLPEMFRRSGYVTTCIGKISHTADGRVFEYNGKGDGRHEVPQAWDDLATPFGHWKRGWGVFFAYANGKHREDGQNHRDLMEFVAKKDTDLPDGLLADAAIKKLEQFKTKSQRFFLGLGFFKPHLPFVATESDWQAFENVTIDVAEHKKMDSPFWHDSDEFYKYDTPFEKTRPLPLNSQLVAKRAYLASVRYVDRQIGKVLAALDAFDLADDTIVVVWSDHGWHLGEQQVWGKHTLFERSLNSVLMIRAPGQSKPGLKTAALAQTTDIYPTLVDLCKPKFSKTARPLNGVSLRPIISGEKASVRDVAISYWRKGMSIRKGDHRLVVRLNDGKIDYRALYNIKYNADPTENLADAFPDLSEELSSHMLRQAPGRSK